MPQSTRPRPRDCANAPEQQSPWSLSLLFIALTDYHCGQKIINRANKVTFSLKGTYCHCCSLDQMNNQWGNLTSNAQTVFVLDTRSVLHHLVTKNGLKILNFKQLRCWGIVIWNLIKVNYSCYCGFRIKLTIWKISKCYEYANDRKRSISVFKPWVKWI